MKIMQIKVIKLKYFLLPIIVFGLVICSCTKGKHITLETLLNEMISFEVMSKFPDPYYTCHQTSSYDRASVSPDSINWFRNKDGYEGGNFIRVDTIENRIEKVMLDHKGPGVITRIWITSLDQKATLRFYFDGSETAQFVIPAYDMTQLGVAGAGRGFLLPHTSYSENGVGGSTSYFPIPYNKGCKITVEIPSEIENNPRYYQINYRKYEKSAELETFSSELASNFQKKIEEVNRILLNPEIINDEYSTNADNKTLVQNDSISIELPEGQNAIYEIVFNLSISDPGEYAQTMRELIFTANFDGKQTMWVPIGDFSGGGMGSPKVSSWFLNSDGQGKIISRWIMPYKNTGNINITNLSSSEVDVSISIKSKALKWDKQSLYFHTSWKQETGLDLFNCGEDVNDPDCYEWKFSELSGKGILRGDVLSLYNYTQSWYGEGDEKIWVDDDTFPSHFGTGTEDYYNSSWAPVVVFHTPFGGATRADTTSSQGYNNWLRTRNLDGIPFKSSLQFYFELLSWFRGNADYSSTVYWYGDIKARAIGTSKEIEATRKLPDPYAFLNFNN